MGKQGPCYHCGARETPLWRNGPQGKPVLCNACGSRWRIRGTLENYTPNRGHPGGRRKLRKTRDVVPAIPLSHRTVSATRRNSLTSCILNPSRASEFRRLPRTRSESVTFLGINSENEDDDGITDSGKDEELMEEADNAEEDYISLSGPLAHIKSLHKELLKLYNEEKSSSMRNGEEEALTDNVNPFMYENEIGFGCFPLKPTFPIAKMEEATLKKASSASSSSLNYHLDAKYESSSVI